MAFLSAIERDYLMDKQGRVINDNYKRVIKHRLQKKMELFTQEELLLLINKGYINSVTDFSNSITDIRNNTKNIKKTQYSYEPWQGVCTG
jgi:hypothetical protein